MSSLSPTDTTFRMTSMSLDLVDRLRGHGLDYEAALVGKLTEVALSFADAAFASRDYILSLERRQAVLVDEVRALNASIVATTLE